MAKSDLHLDWATHAATKYACENWHYSKCVPMPPWNSIGVWEGGQFVGVVLFGRGASPNLGKPYGLKNTELCELVRVALSQHHAPVSRIVSVSINLLYRSNPGLKMIVSFADTNHGHHGGIYQAGNWIYTGMTPPKIHFRDSNGKVWHNRQATTTGWTNQFGKRSRGVRRSDCERVELDGKHRYIYPLDDEMRALIMPLAKPYPKRAVSIAVDAPGFQSGEGGSSPTTALQSQQEEKA